MNEVRVLVTADTKKAQADIDHFSNSLGSGLASAAKIGAAAVVGLGAAGVGGLALSINAAANFEKALDQVGAVAGATNTEMKGLSDTALRIGKDTAYSATEAAAAMEMLAANGVSVADIMNGAADAAVALAAAGGTDLKTAADTASTAMAVWGLNAKDMTDVVNRLAGAANVSRFGVEDMSLAIAAGGGAAHTAGVEFDDFAAAIAAIAPSFSSGQDAGTSMKTFLANLVPDTNRAKDAFRELGITTADGSNKFFDASGNLRSMRDIVDVLHQATAGLSEEQKTLALNTMFGSDAMRAAAALAGLTGEQYEQLFATMGNTSAADVAAQRMGNFKGSLESLKGSLETIEIEIGSKLLPVLTDFASAAAEALPKAFDWLETHLGPLVQGAVATATDAFDRFKETIKDLAENKVAVAGALGAIAAAWTLVAVSATAAAVAEAAALLPFAAVVLAVGGVVAALTAMGVNWRQVWEDTSRVAQEQFAKFQGYYASDLKPAFDNIQAAVEAVVGVFKDNWSSIEPVVRTVAELVKTHIDLVKNELKLIVDIIGGDWKGAWEDLKNIVRDNVLEVKLIVEAMFEGLRALVAIASDVLVDVGRAIAAGLLRGLKEGAEAVWGEVSGWGNKIKSLKGPMDVDRSLLTPQGYAISLSLADGLVAGFNAVVVPAVSAMAGAIKDLYAGVPDYVRRLSPAAGGSKSNAGPYVPFDTSWYIGGGQSVMGPSDASKIPVGSYIPGLGYKTANGWEQTQGAAADIDAAYKSGAYGNAAAGQPIQIQLVVDGAVLAQAVTNHLARAM